MRFSILAIVASLFLGSPVLSQLLDGVPVGPLTPHADKLGTVCNVLDYGGVADGKTCVGPAIISAFKDCVLKASGGATLLIPPGDYLLTVGVSLTGGNCWAFQLDGLLTLITDGAYKGNAIVISKAKDFHFFSSNNKGAIQGNGYLKRISGSGQNARLLRFVGCSNYVVHNLILVDAPAFHLFHNDATNMETHSITIRGPNIGGSDGVNVMCTSNCHIHHVEVTNRDECVCVKSPSKNILIEEIYCNHSGGMSIGSMDAAGGGQVENIHMRSIYVHQSTQMLMIKTWPGGNGASGYVRNSIFENFCAYDSTYGLDIDQYWYNRLTPNTGAIQLSNLRFSNWTGTVNNGKSRGPIVIRGSNVVPLTNITLEGFDMWTENGNQVIHQCRNVYGTGYCARELPNGATPTEFSSSITLKSAPTAFVKPQRPAWGNSGYGVTLSIPVYTPAVMWEAPGFGAAGRHEGTPSPTLTLAPTPTPTPTPSPSLEARRAATHPHARRF